MLVLVHWFARSQKQSQMQECALKYCGSVSSVLFLSFPSYFLLFFLCLTEGYNSCAFRVFISGCETGLYWFLLGRDEDSLLTCTEKMGLCEYVYQMLSLFLGVSVLPSRIIPVAKRTFIDMMAEIMCLL